MRVLPVFAALPAVLAAPVQALAAGVQRPIPNPQSATAELWFFVASVGLLLALAAVHWLVARR
ncbi:hypothetical protein [Labrenzia sp. 011]|uniref:hypothetical protein n=1 Tax=Labrenzia sp. 011 TaxID=2171494 RepID=UPI000D5135E6|nr:hypothetical protein [Labrenzia sp. 011]PVB61505.1 hypothetical protein DCO57_11745 [Labrenzia sp. 011]